MIWILKRPLAAAIVTFAATSVGGAAEPEQRFVDVAVRLTEAINKQDCIAAQQDFSKIMLNAFPPEKAAPFYEELIATYGKFQTLESPRLSEPNLAVVPARLERGILDIKIVLDGEDKITGLWFLPHAPEIPALDKHETPLRLPFNGKWLTFWGGDTQEQNRHHSVLNQQFAFDFLITGDNGKTYKTDGAANEDYYAFGQEVLAPAGGVVTDVIRGVRDNAPGSMNPYSALGNAVVIQHRENEVSVLAHFKQGSIRVNVGDKVEQGLVLGLCGNSGNSSEPHIHYHLQNTPIIQDGTGIKCFFENVSVQRNGATTVEKRCSPEKGDVIALGPKEQEAER